MFVFGKCKKTLINNNNIIFIYYFKNYYKKYKNKSFEKILNNIFKNINNEPFTTNMNIKYVILYPLYLEKEIQSMNINENNKIICIYEYNKSIIRHLLY